MKKIVKISAITVALLLVAAIVTGVIYVAVTASQVKLQPDRLTPYSANLEVFDTDGNNLLEETNYVEYEEISPHLINAFVALEDKRFFEHKGLDYIRIAKAIVTNISKGGFAEGGSTITQQLIKNTHLSNEKTIKRKIQEAKLATDLEKQYSKEQILEMYMNVIYLGGGIHGVKAGAAKFFGKTCAELSLAESALIAGITKNPKKYYPADNLENALERQKTVLGAMKKEKKITEEQYSQALEEVIYIAKTTGNETDTDKVYVSAALRQAESVLNISQDDLARGGYKVYTYMQPEKQKNIYLNATHKAFEINTENDTANKICMLAENGTAGISAYYGNISYDPNTFRRQPGSLIKPAFSYAAALEKGIDLYDTIIDEPTDFNGYSPRNYEEKYLGATSISKTLAESSNIAAVKLALDAGLKSCFNTAAALGYDFAAEDYHLASALGGLTYGSTVPQVLSSYCAIADNGRFKHVSFIKKITDKDGNIIYSHENSAKTQAIKKSTAGKLTYMMTEAVKDGTAKKMQDLDFNVAAKTGTVAAGKAIDGMPSKNTDAWCAAYDKDVSLIVWFGTENPQKQGYLPSNVTGGSYSTLLAKNILLNLNRDKTNTTVFAEKLHAA